MARKSFTESTWRTDPWFKKLCKAVVACRTEQQAAEFLRDVGTLTELKDWSERLEMAERIMQGQTYREITEDMGVSTTTVTRVARYLKDGKGYSSFLQKLHGHHSAARKRGERLVSNA